MKCERVLRRLSLLVDDMLDARQVAEVEGHLQGCAACRKELDRLVDLRRKLGLLQGVAVPDYLPRLLLLRLEALERDSWRVRLRESLELWWSRVRTTEGIWYWTRALGTTTTFILFLALYTAMSPLMLPSQSGATEHAGSAHLLRQQLATGVLKNLGLMPLDAQRKPISPTDPMINELYLVNFGQSAMRSAKDDSFSVVTAVDKRGAVTIRDVLEYPADASLLNEFSAMIASARYRPASQNGRAVDSFLVLSFSKISVYE